MNRTGELAADVAWARPPAIPVAMILGYNGSARPSMAQIQAWGRPFLCGFESSTTRAYAGGDAGEADSAFSCASFDELGYPRTCGSWVCAADANSTPAQYLPNVREYGRRYALRQAAGGRPGPIAAYGNPDAVEACCAGIRDAGLEALRWGVGTWGYGEGRGPNLPPAQADAELIQSGNTPGPAEGTDLNWLYAPVSVFAPLGAVPAPPAPSAPLEDSMEIVVMPRPDAHPGNYARLILGNGVKLNDWLSDGSSGPGPNQETYGVPNGVAAYGPKNVPLRRIDDLPTRDAFLKASDLATANQGGHAAAPADTELRGALRAALLAAAGELD